MRGHIGIAVASFVLFLAIAYPPSSSAQGGKITRNTVLGWRSDSLVFLRQVDGLEPASECGGAGVYKTWVGAEHAVPLITGPERCPLLQFAAFASLSINGRWLLYGGIDPTVDAADARLVDLRDGTARRVSCIVRSRWGVASPDGGSIAAVSADGHALQTFRSDCSRRTTVYRVRPGRELENVSWSPDGERLLTVSHGRTPGSYAIAILNLGPSARTRELTSGSTACWSPGGDLVAYIAHGRSFRYPSAIHLIRADGSGDRIIFRAQGIDPGSGPGAPLPSEAPYGPMVWSPDGRFLAFSRFRNAGTRSGTSIWLLRPAGSELLRPTIE